MIPTSIDGTDITGATIDGTDVTEITVDGQTVFELVADPPDVANLKLRYDAKLETYANNASGVSLTDQAGSFDATGSNGVGFTTSGTNGHNAYTLDGVSDSYSVPSSTTDFEFMHDGSGGSLYAVINMDPNIGAFEEFVGTGGDGGAGFFLGPDNSGGVLPKINNAGSNTGGGTQNGFIYDLHTSSSSSFGSDVTLFEDNSQVHTRSASFTSGASNTDLSARTGYLGEILSILIYDVQHGSSTRQSVYNFLDARFS
jgi:hypothetical protein